MNQFPNSIRNNMVNTTPFRNYNDYNIQILSEPDPDISYEPQRGFNFKYIVIGAVLGLALSGGMAYIGHRQYQSMIENTAVVERVSMPSDATLMVTKNPLYSYIETPDGHHVSQYDGMEASDWAKPYVEEAQMNAKQK